MYDINERGIDEDLPDEEQVKPSRLPKTKRMIDMEVAMISGVPMKTVNSVTAIFLDLVMSAIAEHGELYLDQFGTFNVKQYKGKVMAQHQLGKKTPRARRTMIDIDKNEIRFKKSRGFRRRLQDHGW